MPNLSRLKNLESRLGRYLVVVDLEATCCSENTIPVCEMETIEVGLLVLDQHDSLRVVDEYSSFVRPIRHPRLTSFCMRLTTIQQADVDRAPSYPEVSSEVECMLARYPDCSWASWGNYDRNQIAQDSRLHGVGQCLPESLHSNFKAFFSSVHGLGKQMGMKRAVQRCGLDWVGTHHRAISDARNLAAVSHFVLGRKPLPDLSIS